MKKSQAVLLVVVVLAALGIAAGAIILAFTMPDDWFRTLIQKTAQETPENQPQSGQKNTDSSTAAANKDVIMPVNRETKTPAVSEDTLFDALLQMAEYERMNGFESGSGLLESTIREQAGDYAGSVVAAFKEVYWNYMFAQNDRQITDGKTAIEKGLREMRTIGQERGFGLARNGRTIDPDTASAAVDAVILFFNGDYAGSRRHLVRLFPIDGSRDSGQSTKPVGGGAAPWTFTEPDGFPAWMGLVCALETATASNDEETLRSLRASYSAIRARYQYFPAYWYFGARNMKGADASAFAERAINLAPSGPFAEESRAALAVWSGLTSKNGAQIKTKLEIDRVITEAVEQQKPQTVSSLFPLLSLPDNPFTLYTAQALRDTARDTAFSGYFKTESQRQNSQKTDRNNTRLSERLAYIAAAGGKE
jgi:hypothetical protein